MKNPFEKREPAKPAASEGEESNVVNFEPRVVIARDALNNPIGTAPDTISAGNIRRELAQEEDRAA